MPASKSTMRSLLAVITLAALTTTASGLTLAMHLSACHTSCQHGCEDEPPQDEPTGQSEQQKKTHDPHSCPTCQILLGTPGKYYHETPAEISFSFTQTNFASPYISTFTSQHRLLSAVPRGPPTV